MEKIVAILLVSLTISSSTLLVDDVRETVIGQVESAWAHLKATPKDGQKIEDQMKQLGQLLKKIPESIDKVEDELRLYEYEEALKSLSQMKNVSGLWKQKWSEIITLTSPVEILYGHFKIFPDMPESFAPGSAQMDFDALTVTDLILKPLYTIDNKGTSTLTYMIDHAHSTAISKRDKDVFTLMVDYIDEALDKSNWCLWNNKTPQRLVYGFYTSLLLTDVKEYAVVNFARMLQYVINGTLNANDGVDATLSLRSKALEKNLVAKGPLGKSSPGFWKCDPPTYVEGQNFAQFRELLQGYIENEVRMHPKGSCKQSCSDYTFVKSRCQYPDDESCFKHRACTGDLVECRYIAADATVCLADPPRRFDYIDYRRGPVLGKLDTCKGETTRRDSYWRVFYHCSNCFCLCDDPNSPTTVRHISLAPVTTEVKSNEIVTGVRFVMKDEILHMQIQSGVASKDGGVLPESVEWKPMQTLTKRNGQLVTQLNYANRAFDLDDVLVPPNYVVTGVRFRNLGAHVNFEVQATQINPLTAELIPSSSHWISNDNTPESNSNPRRRLSLDDVDVPTLTKSPSVPDSTHDQYLEFGATSRTKDVSQTTIPFIDTQSVVPSPPSWLSGIGIYHKGRSGYGGFIAPRVFTKSVTDLMRSQFEEEEDDNDY